MHALTADPLFIALKAALAAGLAVTACGWLGVRDLLSAAFVALLAVSPTLSTGARRSLEQLAAGLLAGTLSAAAAFFLPLPVPLVAVLVTAASVGGAFALGMGRSHAAAGFSGLYVLLIPGQLAWETLALRLASVALGCLCALVVNAVVTAPFYARVFEKRRARVAAMSDAAMAETGPGRDAALWRLELAARQALEEIDDALAEARWRPGVPVTTLGRIRADVQQRAERAAAERVRTG